MGGKNNRGGRGGTCEKDDFRIFAKGINLHRVVPLEPCKKGKHSAWGESVDVRNWGAKRGLRVCPILRNTEGEKSES